MRFNFLILFFGLTQMYALDSLTVDPLISDHMVLQQQTEITIWGTAQFGESVSVSGSWGSEGTSVADAKGSWYIQLGTPEAGGPFTLNVKSSNKEIVIKDVMIGEVWLASGQSNMEMPLRGWPPSDTIKNSEVEIAQAQYSAIRMFNVEKSFSINEVQEMNGNWAVCSPESAGDFSASAYFFARRLFKELDIPIGIIHSSWGGTPAESWVSKEDIKSLGDFDSLLHIMEDTLQQRLTDEWFKQANQFDIPEEAEEWGTFDLHDTELDHTSNDKIILPGQIDLYNGQDINGAFWFKKEITLNDNLTDYTFVMGPVDDVDAVFFNGVHIGSTVHDFSNDRNYNVDQSIINEGRNIISIRVIDTGGPGSIQGDLKLTNEKGFDLDLNGEWDYSIFGEFYNGSIYTYDLETIDFDQRPSIFNPSPWTTPSCLYNSMIFPLYPYCIKGAIWYQGESNVGRDEQYERLFPVLIKSWRKKWDVELPFYFVQISPFNYNKENNPENDVSQKLRNAQRKTLSLSKTGMVLTMDIGDTTNIHPANKQDVGFRLASLALKNEYDKNIVASGPLFKSVKIKKGIIKIDFDCKGSGLIKRGNKLKGFEIAGADKVFVKALATINRNSVFVNSPNVKNPVYVRYGWTDTSEASLFNKEGLPASCFTTEY